MSQLAFTVFGRPASQGSHRIVPTKQGPRMVDDSARTRPWRQAIAAEAIGARNGQPNAFWTAPVQVIATFHLARPKAHVRSGRHWPHLRDSAPSRPASKPDIDKLARALLDALTGVLWRDDAQVTDLVVRKRYAVPGEPERADIEIRALPPTVAAAEQEALTA
jgi:crossover junction endodeoxyribonuclease RusA